MRQTLPIEPASRRFAGISRPARRAAHHLLTRLAVGHPAKALAFTGIVLLAAQTQCAWAQASSLDNAPATVQGHPRLIAQ